MKTKIPGLFFIILGIGFGFMSIDIGSPGIFPFIISVLLITLGSVIFFSKNGNSL